MADPPKCQRCFMRLDMIPPTCLYCKHWKPLQPDEPFFNTEFPGAVGKCHHPTPYERLGTLRLVVETDRCHQFEERTSVRPICQTCAFWEHRDEPQSPNAGTCHNPKFAYGFPVNEKGKEHLPSDGLMFVDDEEECAYLWTGPNFGCIHHQPRT